jgi:hypothetical protein
MATWPLPRVLLPALVLLGQATAVTLKPSYQYCVVGAGPGGLQIGHYMQLKGTSTWTMCFGCHIQP